MELIEKDPDYRGSSLAETILGYDARVTEAEAALAELVACKDIKDSIEAVLSLDRIDGTERVTLAEFDAMVNDYARRKPLAWAEARRVLGLMP